MIASLSDSSLKQYESCFKKWWFFCKTNQLQPFDCSVPKILEFLTSLFNNGAARSTINCYRSAVSLLVGADMARDDRMMRFFEGISKLRPSQPKYESTWDPRIVLDFLSSLSDNEVLSIKDLSMKLICLLALVTGHRMQTFSLIKIENIERRDEFLEIKIPDRIKNSRKSKNQPSLILPYFLENKKVCAASALECYIFRTANIRNKIQRLFLSVRKPYKAVGPQTLSHWVKDILSKSGVDTEIFSAHSTRHASTSAAKRKGLSIDTVRRTAGWTEKSKTFAKFYDLNLTADRTVFAKTILNM